MCNFFSAVWDGRKNLYYFSGEQRLAEVKMQDETRPNYDSHASICSFYNLKEDAVEKLEYNPFTDKLEFDNATCKQYESDVRSLLDQIDWMPLAGDVKGVREFIGGLKDIPWFKPDGTIQTSDKIKLFDTKNAARDAARDAAWDAARNAALNAALNAARNANRKAAMNAACDAARNAVLYAELMYACAGLPIETKHVAHVTARWDLWKHGYGVICDMDGVLYCYKAIK